jgi:hypothetical protein
LLEVQKRHQTHVGNANGRGGFRSRHGGLRGELKTIQNEHKKEDEEAPEE